MAFSGKLAAHTELNYLYLYLMNKSSQLLKMDGKENALWQNCCSLVKWSFFFFKKMIILPFPAYGIYILCHEELYKDIWNRHIVYPASEQQLCRSHKCYPMWGFEPTTLGAIESGVANAWTTKSTVQSLGNSASTRAVLVWSMQRPWHVYLVSKRNTKIYSFSRYFPH